MTKLQNCEPNKILTEKYTVRPGTIIIVIKSALAKKLVILNEGDSDLPSHLIFFNQLKQQSLVFPLTTAVT